MGKICWTIGAVLVIAMGTAARADDATRFPPLTPEQMSPEQKAWADDISKPPRNAKVRRAAIPRLYPEPGTGAASFRALGLSALAYVIAAAAERARDPDHRAAMDRAI